MATREQGPRGASPGSAPDPRPPAPGPRSLQSLGEFGLIARLRARAAAAPTLVRGIGDDAAVLAPTPGLSLLATADAFVEEIHFSFRLSRPDAVGHRAMVANLSDIAAMGGIPRAALVCLGLPPEADLDVVDGLYEGLQRAAAAAATAIAGGDTVRSRAGVLLSITLLGEVESARYVTRAGARPGDRLWVSGPLGGSAAGLAWLRAHGPQAERPGAVRDAVACYEAPVARLALGRTLALEGMARAMLDLSDGIGGDARRLAEESAVGVRIEAGGIPVHPGAAEVARRLGGDALAWAIGGGEDYELLFAADPAADVAAWAAGRGFPAPACIGAVVPVESGCTLVGPDGSARPLPAGYDHLAPA